MMLDERCWVDSWLSCARTFINDVSKSLPKTMVSQDCGLTSMYGETWLTIVYEPSSDLPWRAVYRRQEASNKTIEHTTGYRAAEELWISLPHGSYYAHRHHTGEELPPVKWRDVLPNGVIIYTHDLGHGLGTLAISPLGYELDNSFTGFRHIAPDTHKKFCEKWAAYPREKLDEEICCLTHAGKLMDYTIDKEKK